MKKAQEPDFFKNIKVTYDPELDKYDNVILFPEKYELARKLLDRAGHPGEAFKRILAEEQAEAQKHKSKK